MRVGNKSALLGCCLLALCLLGLVLGHPALVAAAEPRSAQQVDGRVVQVDAATEPGLSAQAAGESVTLRVKSNGAAPYEVNVFAQDSYARWRQLRPTVEKTQSGEDWIITLSGLDFQSYSGHRVYISTDYAFLYAPATAEMAGEETVVQVDAANCYPFQLSVPPTWGLQNTNITLGCVFPDGRSATIGEVEPGTLVPIGDYHVMLVAETADSSYVLSRVNWSLQSDQDVISFSNDDLVTLTAKPQLPSGIQLCSVESYQRADVDYSSSMSYRVTWKAEQDGSFTCQFSKGSYADINISYYLHADPAEEWIYQASVPFPYLTGDDLIEHDLSTLQATIDQSMDELQAGEEIYMWGNFQVADALGHSWSIYDSNWDDLLGTITLLDSSDQDVFTGTFVNGRITLPDHLNGDYALRYEVVGGPIAVRAATRAVHILAPVFPEITGTISLPGQQVAENDVVVKLSSPDMALSTQVVIEAGESSVTYSLPLPTSYSSFRVKYEILSGGDGLLPWGYPTWSGGTSALPGQADYLRAGETASFVLAPTRAAADPIVFWLPNINPEQLTVNCAYLTPNGDGMRYQHLWSIKDSAHIEPADGGWLVGLPDLDFSNASSYQIGISTGDVLHMRAVSSADLNQPITLSADGYTELQFSMPVDFGTGANIRLTSLDGSGIAWCAGDVQPGARVPAGTYHVQAFSGHNQPAFMVSKINLHVAGETCQLTFAAEELASILITLPAGIDVNMFACPADCSIPSSYSVEFFERQDGRHALTLSKGEYAWSNIAAYKDDWYYRVELPELTVDGPLDFGTLSLCAKLSLDQSTLLPGASIYAYSDQVDVVDELGYAWEVDRQGQAQGQLRLVDANQQSRLVKFVNGVATLPTDCSPGTYTLTYEVPDSPIPITPSLPVSITLSGEAPQPVTLRVPTGGDSLSSWQVSIWSPSGSSIPTAIVGDFTIIGDGEDQLVGIAGLNWQQHASYYVLIQTPDALFAQAVTAADCGSETVLNTANHVPLNIILPLDNSGAADSGVDLHYVWPGLGVLNGINVQPGVLLPAGTYHLQAWSRGGSQPYSLVRQDVQLSLGNNDVVFAASDVTQLTTAINCSQPVSELSSYYYLNQQEMSRMRIIPWVSLGDNQFTTWVSSGEYDRFNFVVRVTDGAEAWNYKVTRHLNASATDSNLTLQLTQLSPVFQASAGLLFSCGTEYNLSKLVQLSNAVGEICQVAKVIDSVWVQVPGALDFYPLPDAAFPLDSASVVDGRFVASSKWSGTFYAAYSADTGPVPFVAGPRAKVVFTGELPKVSSEFRFVCTPGAEVSAREKVLTIDYPAHTAYRVYRLGETASWQTYEGPITLSGADLTVYAQSGDSVGNIYNQSLYVKLTVPGSQLHLTVGQQDPVNIGLVRRADNGGDILVCTEYLVKALGMSVTYEPSDGSLRLISGDKELLCTLGQTGLAVNGVAHPMPTAPVLVEGKLYLPVKHILAPLGYRAIEHDDDIWLLQTEQALDLDGDQQFGVGDLAKLGLAYGSKATDTGFASKFDLTADDVIDLYDLVFLARWLVAAN